MRDLLLKRELSAASNEPVDAHSPVLVLNQLAQTPKVGAEPTAQLVGPVQLIQLEEVNEQPAVVPVEQQPVSCQNKENQQSNQAAEKADGRVKRTYRKRKRKEDESATPGEKDPETTTTTAPLTPTPSKKCKKHCDPKKLVPKTTADHKNIDRLNHIQKVIDGLPCMNIEFIVRLEDIQGIF